MTKKKPLATLCIVLPEDCFDGSCRPILTAFSNLSLLDDPTSEHLQGTP